MVNKIRKKDGSIKQPYEFILPFVEVIALKKKLKACARYVYADNKSYGTNLWGNAGDFVNVEKVQAIINEYIPEYKINTNTGWFGFSLYIAYKEYDMEI